ncbi:hypothetical protein FisN_2Hu068 [Fistulifera solaris]|uniref:MYND-type domain-containing protein n=1 Tax=Fistulifera solaris TaxID=1519565 RepID=A0A1Z5KPK7_FISSO|nr:hypothetical protein FisN_2Hu068 [Fistulifera solaris]|eukprot:GAX28107.1 hypothetical protein FisN_2Hu068 [Fistulifera solaris]
MTDDTTPMYEGKDIHVRQEPCCLHCWKQPPKLLKCSQCKSAWYCDSACQKNHYKQKHRKTCQKIAKFTKIMQQQTVLLGVSMTDNIFETEVGYFWDLPHTQTYMEASYDLADGY